ncbi:MAG TPA: tRNA (guanosine(37)-N1)-methyltransferase TrmD [Bacteroidetes bacterium]|nr:tRNA (guanosine(37)-N1)-methyltransferase TrmD [Bacteroidota bacterium]
MRIDILSGVPDQLISPLETSIVKRARNKGLVDIHIHNIRDYATDKHKCIDDAPYGGGAGMVMKVEPIAALIRKLQAERNYDEVIFLTPDGEVLKQAMANELCLKSNFILLAGHYKGVDQRVRDLFITREISIGDYVLSGGELPALVLTDALVRLIPGVLGDETSALSDSFQSNFLDAPAYTRPADFEGHRVPEVLLGGNHAHIDQWRDEQAFAKTKARRPDLLED